MHLHKLAMTAALAASLSGIGFAQGFNLDIGPTNFGTPSTGYGAASGQAGTWNSLSTATVQAGALLTDINGNATSVMLTAVAASGFTVADFSFDNTGTLGDDQALLDDLCDSSTSTWTFTGLADGSYSVFVYSWAPDNRTGFFSDITVSGGSAGTVQCGGQLWGGTFNNPGQFMTDTVNVVGGTLIIDVANPVVITPTSINGFQLVPANCGTVVSYCTAKPNSLGCTPVISGAGTPSATATSGFVVQSVNMRNNKVGLLFYTNGGRAATPFTGGTLCVGGALKRVQGLNTGGTPAPVNDCTGVFSVDMNSFAQGLLGGNPNAFLLVPGTVVDAQFWGRDPGFAAPNNTQLSDGLEWTICN